MYHVRWDIPFFHTMSESTMCCHRWFRSWLDNIPRTGRYTWWLLQNFKLARRGEKSKCSLYWCQAYWEVLSSQTCLLQALLRRAFHSWSHGHVCIPAKVQLVAPPAPTIGDVPCAPSLSAASPLQFKEITILIFCSIQVFVHVHRMLLSWWSFFVQATEMKTRSWRSQIWKMHKQGPHKLRI